MKKKENFIELCEQHDHLIETFLNKRPIGTSLVIRKNNKEHFITFKVGVNITFTPEFYIYGLLSEFSVTISGAYTLEQHIEELYERLHVFLQSHNYTIISKQI